VPGRAGGQLVAFQQHHVVPARAGEVIGDRGADGTAADDKGFDMGLHGAGIAGPGLGDFNNNPLIPVLTIAGATTIYGSVVHRNANRSFP
jgi:hypothetical protein